MHSNHCSVVYNSQDMETIYVSIHGWMDKKIVVCVHNGILHSHKKEWNLATCDNMGGPQRHYTKWNTSDRGRQIPYDLSYMWTLKK